MANVPEAVLPPYTSRYPPYLPSPGSGRPKLWYSACPQVITPTPRVAASSSLIESEICPGSQHMHLVSHSRRTFRPRPAFAMQYSAKEPEAVVSTRYLTASITHHLLGWTGFLHGSCPQFYRPSSTLRPSIPLPPQHHLRMVSAQSTFAGTPTH